MKRSCQVHYYPSGPNNTLPWGLTSLSKLRADSVWMGPPTSAASTSPPNNATCTTTAEHSSRPDAGSRYSFIRSPRH
ncbi:hypothetical protein EYF80_062784 [Liparis tanakae]|uniref:Uncharacterized protein n=1 Tax=Liparis tanakae TaxID=230148 RepID=A0A4Z2EEC2_9TELE|nr:hypothetical protein EYF80_062784 [Liparis tanakae]